jgi:hypothetical protein
MAACLNFAQILPDGSGSRLSCLPQLPQRNGLMAQTRQDTKKAVVGVPWGLA